MRNNNGYIRSALSKSRTFQVQDLSRPGLIAYDSNQLENYQFPFYSCIVLNFWVLDFASSATFKKSLDSISLGQSRYNSLSTNFRYIL